jgi:sensor histidine kinase YesM
MDCRVTVTGNTDGWWLRPLLLIPLIENSFKHGMSQQTDTKWIALDMRIEEDILFFHLANSCTASGEKPGRSRMSGGVGLENVQKRLELLYPGQHSFNVQRDEDSFSVDLTLHLQKATQLTQPGTIRVNSSAPAPLVTGHLPMGSTQGDTLQTAGAKAIQHELGSSQKPDIPWYYHVVFWTLVMVYMSWAHGIDPEKPVWYVFATGALYLPGAMLVVYPMLYFLFPRFLYRKKFLPFFAGYLVLLMLARFVSLGLKEITAGIDFAMNFHRAIGHFITPFVNISSIAASAVLIRYFYFKERKSLIASKEKSRAELELLKSQIHPHFLFNTLNSLFAHTLKKSPESPRIVVGLSDLLRFMVYESRVEFIPLEQEIQLLKNYLDLEKLRYGDDIDISFTYSGDIDRKLIRPLLLLPLVENCFRHGTSMQIDQKWISLNLHVDGSRLQVKLANSREEGDEEAILNPGKGTGIDNLVKRLKLLYPDDHIFAVNEAPDMFRVNLEITLVEDTIASLREIQKTPKVHDLEMPVGG